MVRRLWGLERVEPPPVEASNGSASAYATDLRSHPLRRFSKQEVGQQPPMPEQASLTTRSSISFGQGDDRSARTDAWERIRTTVARRGLKGWRVILAQVQNLDRACLGRMIKSDWNHLLKTTGMGINADEQEKILLHF